MASSPVDSGTGTTITFTDVTQELLAVDFSGVGEIPDIATSHMSTAAPAATEVGNATFLPGEIMDPGLLDAQFNFNPDDVPPIGVTGELVITFPELATWTGQAYLKSVSDITVPLDDRMTATYQFKFSGPIVIAAPV